MTTIPDLIEIKQTLAELYFDSLEENGVQFFDYEEVGFFDNRCTFIVIKPEFQLSHDEMAVELGFVNFQDFAKTYVFEETGLVLTVGKEAIEENAGMEATC